MKIFILFIAGVFCLGSIRAADTPVTNQGKKQKAKAGQTNRAAGAPQGKIYVATDAGVYDSGGNNKRNLSSKGKPKARDPLTGQTRLIVGDDQGVHNSVEKQNKKNQSSGRRSSARSGTDAQGRLLVGTDNGIWRSEKGKPNKVKAGAGATNRTGQKKIPLKGKTIPEN